MTAGGRLSEQDWRRGINVKEAVERKPRIYIVNCEYRRTRQFNLGFEEKVYPAFHCRNLRVWAK